MNATKISAIAIALLTIIFTWCGRDRNETSPADSLESFLYTQADIDSLKDVFDNRLAHTVDSFQYILDVVEVKADIPAKTITKIVTKYEVEYIDTVSTDLSAQLDSLERVHLDALDELQANNRMNEHRYQQLLRETMTATRNVRDTVKLNNNLVKLEVTLPEKLVSLSVQDTLTITHTTSRKWFLGKKRHHVSINHTNPYVQLKGTTYIIK